MKKLIAGLVIVALLALLSTQMTIFVVQPIGAIPEGRTLIVRRLPGARFVESADSICDREQGGVSLLCRGSILAAYSQGRIYARLPYMDWLYLWSTGGSRYNR